MAESFVGRANPFVRDRKVRVEFDFPLKQGERCLRVASQEELHSLIARLECFQGGAERFFQRLIEAGQRFGWLPELPPKARDRRSQLMDYLITSANVGPFLRQGRFCSAVECPDLQVISVTRAGDGISDRHLAIGLTANLACNLRGDL